MIHVRHSAVATIPVDVAFSYVDDHRTVPPEWMFGGVSRFEPVGGAQVNGLGAVFDAAMQIGPKSSIPASRSSNGNATASSC